MTNKAYIAANEEQEREVLEQLEKEGCSWNDIENTPPTEWHLGRYPYAIFVKDGKKLIWGFNVDVTEVEIMTEDKQDKVKIRKEEHMSDKYVVSQEFMNKLNDWKNNLVKYNEPGGFIDIDDLEGLPVVVNAWWGDEVSDEENNNRLIAIIRWVNGEDVFEVEKPKKWLIRSKDCTEQGNYLYVMLDISHGVKKTINFWDKDVATRFDTKEEAESWANSHQEVVEVEE